MSGLLFVGNRNWDMKECIKHQGIQNNKSYWDF